MRSLHDLGALVFADAEPGIRAARIMAHIENTGCLAPEDMGLLAITSSDQQVSSNVGLGVNGGWIDSDKYYPYESSMWKYIWRQDITQDRNKLCDALRIRKYGLEVYSHMYPEGQAIEGTASMAFGDICHAFDHMST